MGNSSVICIVAEGHKEALISLAEYYKLHKLCMQYENALLEIQQVLELLSKNILSQEVPAGQIQGDLFDEAPPTL